MPRTGTKTSSSRTRKFSPSRGGITTSTTRFMLKRPLRCVLRVQEAITLPTSWFGGVSHQGVTPLHFCEKSVKTGAQVYYKGVLQGVVKPLNTTIFNGQKWVFQQNSTPAHKTTTTQEWLRGTFRALSAPRIGPRGVQTSTPLDYKLWAVLDDTDPTSNSLRGTNPMGRHYSLFGGDPRYTAQLVASHRSGHKENFSEDGNVGSPPE